MDLTHPSQENLTYILTQIGEKLSIANPALLDVKDYDLSKYDDLKWLYEHIKNKETLSISETDAFLKELSVARKSI